MKMKKKIGKKILTALASACLFTSLPAWSVQAAAAEGYTYSVNIYAGNRGTFTDTVRLSVDHTKSKSTVQSQVKLAKGMVTVSGLKKDDIITIDLQADSIKLKEENRYYVKGIRQSGRDNSTVATSVFRVDRDAEYVVAYGVQGDMVAYTVNYQDADGNELLPSDTYYGNVGDKPVVAYKYKEGYEPEVMALAKTLDANEAKNVFTFVYTPVDREVITRQVGTAGTITNTVTELVPGAAVPASVPTSVPAAEEEEGEEEETNEEAAAGEEEPPAEADQGEQPAVQQIGDQEVPLAEQDLKDLDEEETPASDIQLDKVVKKGLPLAASIGIAVAAAAGLVILAVVLTKRKSKKGAAP